MRHPGSWLPLLVMAGCHTEPPRASATVAPTPPPKPAGSAAATARSAAGAAAEAPAPTATTCALADVPARRPAASRVVAIGDIHGDLAAARAALRTAGAIDDKDAWIGGALVVVQTGDLLDRGDDEQAIIDLFERLERDATAAGGALVWLLGNHELMNAVHDFRYVTPGGLGDFDDAPGVDPSAAPAEVPAAVRGRVAALSPGGAYARIFAQQNVWAIVGDTLFAHAGMTRAWTGRLDAANRDARCWLDGAAAAEPAALTDDEGPTWTRVWGYDVDCTALSEVLLALKVKRMVVGHTVQEQGMNSVCGGALWRIDVGLARLYDGPIQVLELTDQGGKVLNGRRIR